VGHKKGKLNDLYEVNLGAINQRGELFGQTRSLTVDPYNM